METAFIGGDYPYTGAELSSQFAHTTTGIVGDSAIAWHGPCEVEIENMIDVEDVVKEDSIFSESMVHFIVEVFHRDIFYGIWLQRFMTISVRDYVFEKTQKMLTRKGDDLYLDDKKLNVSIATVSGVSTMVHFGVNISSANTPVPTLSLDDLSLDKKEFAEAILEKLQQEVKEIDTASKKVFTV